MPVAGTVGSGAVATVKGQAVAVDTTETIIAGLTKDEDDSNCNSERC